MPEETKTTPFGPGLKPGTLEMGPAIGLREKLLVRTLVLIAMIDHLKQLVASTAIAADRNQ